MAYIPPDARWYLAEIVEEFTFENEPDNLVHTNLVLVRADSPEEAYEKAMLLGREGNMSYVNTDCKRVTVTFRGLRDLNVIHGELEHGTELIYERRAGVPEQELRSWISPKEDLGVFLAL